MLLCRSQSDAQTGVQTQQGPTDVEVSALTGSVTRSVKVDCNIYHFSNTTTTWLLSGSWRSQSISQIGPKNWPHNFSPCHTVAQKECIVCVFQKATLLTVMSKSVNIHTPFCTKWGCGHNIPLKLHVWLYPDFVLTCAVPWTWTHLVDKSFW